MAGLLVGMTGVVMTYFTVLCVPVGVAVAVLRYRLWDLDRLINRTLTYTLVTALLVVPSLLLVPAAGRLAQGAGSLAVAAATLAAVASSSPCAAGSRTWSTAASTATATTPPAPSRGFAARLCDQVDLDALGDHPTQATHRAGRSGAEPGAASYAAAGWREPKLRCVRSLQVAAPTRTWWAA